jgi:hypothetical protein
MHVCLVIDLLTAIFLVHGLLNSDTRLRKQLCLASLIFLIFVSVRTYIVFAGYFGFFERYPSLTTRSLDFLLWFFGGFWMLFGVMVLAKGVSWIALAFAIYAVGRWLRESRKSIPSITLPPPQSPPALD